MAAFRHDYAIKHYAALTGLIFLRLLGIQDKAAGSGLKVSGEGFGHKGQTGQKRMADYHFNSGNVNENPI